MRWLGYIQGFLVAKNFFTLNEVKEHSKRGYVFKKEKYVLFPRNGFYYILNTELNFEMKVTLPQGRILIGWLNGDQKSQ